MHEEVQKLLSAHLDGELTQADRQRVRVHLEDCAECRREFEQLQKLQQITGSLDFAEPPEEKMRAIEQKLSVQAPRQLGWSFLLGGVAVWVAYAVYLFLTAPDLLTWQRLTAGAIVIGLVLLLVSVARQRWLELPHDRYRGVKK